MEFAVSTHATILDHLSSYSINSGIPTRELRVSGLAALCLLGILPVHTGPIDIWLSEEYRREADDMAKGYAAAGTTEPMVRPVVFIDIAKESYPKGEEEPILCWERNRNESWCILSLAMLSVELALTMRHVPEVFALGTLSVVIKEHFGETYNYHDIKWTWEALTAYLPTKARNIEYADPLLRERIRDKVQSVKAGIQGGPCRRAAFDELFKNYPHK